ncbi:MAG: hypothetical protein M3P27_05085 [Acidobacteriota bacterium]|nr:hypothetical protein [Acidobacteriota bacterium]
MTSLRLLPILIAGVAALAGLGGYALWRARRKTPEQREQERRTRIAQLGRITDGTVIDVSELAGNQSGPGALQLLIYQYDVAGVSYEAAQDVTHLRPFVDLHTCRIGVPASIKYDPQNPGNSIVIAESWSGLRA